MNKERVHYFRCPYCGREGGHSKKVSKSVGTFRIKELYTNVLLLKCAKCSHVCRVQKVGKTLMWQDMSQEERKAHTKESYVSYTLIKSQEETNGEKI